MSKVMRSIVRGPLAPHVTGLAVELLERGYTRSSAEQHICFVAHMDRWLLAEAWATRPRDAAFLAVQLAVDRALLVPAVEVW